MHSAAGARRCSPREIHRHTVIRHSCIREIQLSMYRLSPSKRGFSTKEQTIVHRSRGSSYLYMWLTTRCQRHKRSGAMTGLPMIKWRTRLQLAVGQRYLTWRILSPGCYCLSGIVPSFRCESPLTVVAVISNERNRNMVDYWSRGSLCLACHQQPNDLEAVWTSMRLHPKKSTCLSAPMIAADQAQNPTKASISQSQVQLCRLDAWMASLRLDSKVESPTLDGRAECQDFQNPKRYCGLPVSLPPSSQKWTLCAAVCQDCQSRSTV